MATKNLSYGGNIVVAGHLLVTDYLTAGRAALADDPEIDLVLVPRTSFDTLYRDMAKQPAYALPEAFEREVWVVDDTGQYFALPEPGGSAARGPRIVPVG